MIMTRIRQHSDLIGPIAILSLAYFITAKLGLAFAAVHPSVTTAWMPSGIALAFLLLHGVKIWPGVLIGAFAINASTPVGWEATILISFGNTLEAVAGALFMRRFAGEHVNLNQVRDSLLLLLPVALGATAIAATTGIFALLLSGSLAAGSAPTAWLAWWLGDAIGIVIITPLIICWRRPSPIHARDIRVILLMLTPVAVALATFTARPAPYWIENLLVLLLFPTAVWAALGTGMRAVTVANFLVATIVIVASLLGRGPFAGLPDVEAILLQQSYIYTLALATLLLAAGHAERKSAEQNLRESEERFRSIWETTNDGALIVDEGHVIRFANPAACEMFGYARVELVGQPLARIQPQRFQAAHQAGVARFLATGARARDWKGVEVMALHRSGREMPVEIVFSEMRLQGSHRFVGFIRDITRRKEADKELRSSQALFSRVFEASPVAIVISRISDGHFFEANRAVLDLFGYRREEVLGRNNDDLNVWQDPTQRSFMVERLRESGRVEGIELKLRHRNGVLLDVIYSAQIMEFAGEPCIISTIIDTTARKQIESQRRMLEERFTKIFHSSPNPANVTRLEDGMYLEVNDAWTRVFGWTREEAIGRTSLELGIWVNHSDQQAMVQVLERGEKMYNVETYMRRKGGDELTVLLSVDLSEFDGHRSLLALYTDITERKTAERRIEELATRDSLTGLPNRALLIDRLSQGILGSQRNRELLGLLFIDLDRFKTINDSLGHAAGDEVLKQVAQRLGRLMRKGDTLARIGGDEFVIVLDALRVAEDIGAVAQKIIQTLSDPFMIEGHLHHGSASIGISVFPDDALDGETLMRNADMAMYFAKEHGRNNYQFFSKEMNVRAVERLRMESTLWQAIQLGQFELYYHPKFSLKDNRLTGVEALLRWHHPQLGTILPARFIPIAEETGLIVALGDWVLARACVQSVEWTQRHGAVVPVAVNLSVGQINKWLTRSVHDALAQSGLEARHLELELTESMLMKNVEDNADILRQLSDLGVNIAIDDFGTGYSSLAYLRRFRIDAVKIDQSFVRNVDTNLDDAAIIEAIVALSHSLKLTVVAEGIETEAQKRILFELNCDQCQGYLFCEPLPAAQFEARYLA